MICTAGNPAVFLLNDLIDISPHLCYTKKQKVCSGGGGQMSDVKKLIDLVMSEVMNKAAKSLQEHIYRDEPIIRPASHMSSYVPDEIRSMRDLASERGALYHTKQYNFYRQAKFMENYEDDFRYSGEFFNYFPTYQDMNNNQLRGYFSWRSRVRKGDIRKTSLSFVFVYIYELIHLIGADSAEDGFYKLRDFCEAYYEFDSHIVRYTKNWLIDFAVYYGLDKSLIADMIDTEFDNFLSVLQEYESHNDDELFEAVCALSSYNITNSKLYKKEPEDMKTIVCGVFRKISAYYAKNRKTTLCEKLFGVKIENYYHMFESAVFYDHKKITEHTYEITDSYRFICRDGRWICERYYGSRGRNKWLGDVFRSVDSLMRQKLDFGSPINPGCDTKWILAIIEKEIDELIENKKKNAAPKIEIDVSKLAGIRKSADVIRDKLITDEEREDIEEIPEASEIENVIVQEEAVSNRSDTPLSDDEYDYMRYLLYGGSFNGKTMPSVLADSINDKLFDMFGDIVIAFDGDAPEIIEDYIDELKGIIKP